MNSNQLTGIPPQMFELTQLTTLILSKNPDLKGRFRVEQLSNLESFYAAFTQLNGPLPDKLFARLTKLEILDVQNASLTGTLSEHLALWNNSIQTLRLQNNQFDGSLPTALDSLTRLMELHLEGNAFVGAISESVCDRRGDGFQELSYLSVDCAVECSCCDAYDEKCPSS